MKQKFFLGWVENIVGKRIKCWLPAFWIQCWLPAFSPFPTKFSKGSFFKVVNCRDGGGVLKSELFLKRQTLDAPKLKEFEEDNSEFDENGGKFSQKLVNAVGKGEIARYEQFLLFPHRFQKTYNTDT